jgi:exoribonuclease R
VTPDGASASAWRAARCLRPARHGDLAVVEITDQPNATGSVGGAARAAGRRREFGDRLAIASQARERILADALRLRAATGVKAGGGAQGREDLRSAALVTIDGEDATSTIGLRRAERRGPLLVAIADVSRTCGRARPSMRARERATSVYFRPRAALAARGAVNHLCSLMPEVDPLLQCR